MSSLQFRNQSLGIRCFNIYQPRAWQVDFERSNPTRWVKSARLCRLTELGKE